MALTMNTCGVERVFTPPSEGFTTTFMRIGLTPPVSLYGSDGDYFWNDGTNAYYSNDSKQYVLNKKLFVWEEKTWGGLTSFSANNIWTDGTNIYYSLNDEQYVLNGDTWEEKTWNGLSPTYGSNIWTDGENIYYNLAIDETCYVLNRETDTWEKKTWYGGSTDVYFGTSNVWTDGTNIYHSSWNGGLQYVLNKETDTWETKTWEGLNKPPSRYMWSDGENIYVNPNSGNTNYVLNKETGIWEEKPLTNFLGYSSRLCSDGTNIYQFSTGGSGWVLLSKTAKLYTLISGGSWVKAADLGGS